MSQSMSRINNRAEVVHQLRLLWWRLREGTGALPTCYLSGPMTGLPYFNANAFATVAATLREAGWVVLSPAEHDDLLSAVEDGDVAKLEGFSLEASMEWDIAAIDRSDVVFVMPGWEESNGATHEVAHAHSIRTPVYTFPELREIKPETLGGASRPAPDLSGNDTAAPSGINFTLPVATESDEATNEFMGIPVVTPEELSKIADKLDLVFLPPKDESVAAEADRIVSTDRGADYGHPLDDFGKIIRAAEGLGIGHPHTEEEHAIYMILVKLSREVNHGKRDNRVDICGYAKTLDMVIEERERRGQNG